MILRDSSDLKKLISILSDRFSRSPTAVKRQRLYEIFARSQGFKTDAALRSSLPILVEVDKANKILVPLIEKYDNNSANHYLHSFNCIETAAQLAQPFPVIARYGCLIEIQIDWDDGHISRPYLRLASENATSWDKHYGNCATFTLPARVTEDEYFDLVNEVKPLVDDVTKGYTFNGPEQHASFTAEAEAAIESIYDAVSVFDFLERSDEPAPPWYPFGDDWNGEKSSEDLELTEIRVEDEFLLDHSSSDIVLRQLVAYWMIACDFAVNENALHGLLVDLRKTCRKNFENENN